MDPPPRSGVAYRLQLEKGMSSKLNSERGIPMSPLRRTSSNSTLRQQAIELLESHPYFKGRSKWIGMEFEKGQIRLKGRLPSFFLKQVVQEILRELPGISRIHNDIVVATPHGDIGPNEKRNRNDESSDSGGERLLAYHLRPRIASSVLPR